MSIGKLKTWVLVNFFPGYGVYELKADRKTHEEAFAAAGVSLGSVDSQRLPRLGPVNCKTRLIWRKLSAAQAWEHYGPNMANFWELLELFSDWSRRGLADTASPQVFWRNSTGLLIRAEVTSYRGSYRVSIRPIWDESDVEEGYVLIHEPIPRAEAEAA